MRVESVIDTSPLQVRMRPDALLPKVSVCISTYNHARYVAEAIDSVLAQITTFPVEIIIGEDCSPDGTRDIVESYARRHPALIAAVLPQANRGPMANVRAILDASRGEYIALFDGDDYWTDPTKLQRQVEQLDAHSDWALVHHAVSHVEEESGSTLQSFPPPSWRQTSTAGERLAECNFIQTCSVMFRRADLAVVDEAFWSLGFADWPLFSLLSQQRRIGFLDRTMAHYRVHAGGTWSQASQERRLVAEQQVIAYMIRRASPAVREEWIRRAMRDYSARNPGKRGIALMVGALRDLRMSASDVARTSAGFVSRVVRRRLTGSGSSASSG